jgi:hypothetical protein
MTGTVKTLSNTDAAARIGVSPNTLKLWRHQGKGPPFTKNDPNSPQSGVSYDPADIDAWKAARTFTSTSGYSTAAQRNNKSHMSRSAEASA